MKSITKRVLTERSKLAIKKSVLGIGGSPRRNGNSDVLLDHILQGAAGNTGEAAACQLRDLAFSSCIGCERCRKDMACTGLCDGLSLVYPALIEAQGLVLVSPTHNYNITALMKAFIDRLYCFYEFDNNRPRGWTSRLAGQDRKVVLAAVCEQDNEEDMGFTLDAMRLPIEALGYEVIGNMTVYGTFDLAGVRHKPEAIERAEMLGSKLAESLKKH